MVKFHHDNKEEMRNQRQKITLQEFINTIQTPFDVLKAVSSSSDYAEELNSDNAKTFFAPKQKKRLIRQQSHIIHEKTIVPHQNSPLYNQMAALILITPTKSAPLEIFQWCQKLFPFLNNFPQIVSAGLMMRFAESSLILNQVETTLQTMRWGIGRYDFIICAYLFLCASSKNPIEFDITSLTVYVRVDALTFYYLGINLMMLRKFEKAQKNLQHSLTIHSPSDCSKEIASDFLLCCFLNHFDENQARSLIPDKIDIDGESVDLFSTFDEVDVNDEDSSFSDVFVFLIDDINKEIQRRRLIRFVMSTIRIPVDVLAKKTKFGDVNELVEKLKNLKNEHIINFRIKDGIVNFSQPNIQPIIDKQYDLLMKSMNELNSIQKERLEQNNQNKKTEEEEDFFF